MTVKQRINRNLRRAMRLSQSLNVRSLELPRAYQKTINLLWDAVWRLTIDVNRQDKPAFKKATRFFEDGWRLAETSHEEDYYGQFTLRHDGESQTFRMDDAMSMWSSILHTMGLEPGFPNLSVARYLQCLTQEEAETLLLG